MATGEEAGTRASRTCVARGTTGFTETSEVGFSKSFSSSAS